MDFSPLRASSILALPPPRDRQNAIDGCRFVAGEHFYNHEMFGSLRKGGAVKFVSKECTGLAVAIAMSAFAYATLTGVIVPLMARQLVLNQQEALAMRRLVELPMALSFFFGMLSDSRPVFGLRRKPYMVIGSLVHAMSAIIIAAVSNRFGAVTETVDRPSDASIVVVVILCAFASVGCILTFLCVHTQVIEFSQREPLKKRGVFQASYLILRHLASLGASLFAYATLRSADGDPRIHSTITILLLAFVAILPLPVVWKFWKEELAPPVFNASLSIRMKGQWRILQQRAVWSILVFICVFTLFLGVKFTDSVEIIKNWAGASADNYLLIKSIQDLVVLTTIVTWRHWFMNRHWRMFFCLGPVFTIVPSLFASTFVALDVVRDRTFYRFFTSLGFAADGVIALMNIVPLTEIIPEGSEASTVGIVLSFERLISTFDSTTNNGLFQGARFFDQDQVPLDTAHIRSSVLLSLVLNYGINACALMGLVLLPNQKLDAQQLRIYGGFTKAAASSVAGFGLLLFGYSAVINVMSFAPSLSCYKIAGGDGCT
ncbi:Transmembrane protein, partial [Globisporangium splendens]